MAVLDPQKDYYAVLGILDDADDDTIKQAYRRQARLYHPDSGHGDVDKFLQAQEAYEVLQDVVLRRAYDRQREQRGLTAVAPITLELQQSRKHLPPLSVAQMLYVLVEIYPHKNSSGRRQRLNLALVIDRSTSMNGARMQNVKIAANDLLDVLDPEDRLALVTFSDRAEVIAPSDYAANSRNFKSAIAAMTPAGGTEIYQGLQAGLAEVRRHASSECVNHVILLTDGRTYGDEERALLEARHASAEGINISAFGIGEDWNDEFLDNLVRLGGGVSHYIRAPSEVRTVLKQQIQGLGNTVVQRLRLEFNTVPYVRIQSVYRAAPYMEDLDYSGDNTILLGNLMVNEPIAVVLEMLVEQQQMGDLRLARLELAAEEAATLTPIRLRQDISVTVTQEPLEEPISPKLLNYLARLSVFQLQERAWKALGGGQINDATRYLESAATRLFDMGHRELGQAAMLEVGRLYRGGDPTQEGRKKLRYGTRSLTLPAR